MNRVLELYTGKFLRLLRNAHWEYVERINSRGAGFIIARTDADELVLVEQYRMPLQTRTIELPAGIIGDEDAHRDESVEASALRELEEETGFRGRSARIVFSGPTAPGMTAEMAYFVRVEGLQRVGPGGGVAGEDITVHVVPLAQLDAWLDARQADGMLVDARILAARQLLTR